MPPEQMPVPSPQRSLRGLWLVVVILVVLAAGIFIGVQLAHSNSDYVCSQAYNDTQTGACTNGSWGPWTSVNGALQRTYTGTQTTVNFAGVATVSCSHPSSDISQATGTTTTQYAACQIVQSGTNPAGNSGSGTVPPSGGTVTVTSETQTTDTVSTTASQTTGSYADYQNIVDATLATGTISVSPSIVRSGQTTQVYWTSDRMKSCVVTATNNDTWNATSSPLNGETSSPITQQTTYTLTCLNSLNNSLVSHATVTILPTYQEI